MSTVSKSYNFTPVRDLAKIERSNFPLVDPTLADPMNAVCLVGGEWMSLDNDSKLVRASTIGSLGNQAARRSYPLWAERGSSDLQSMGERAPAVWWSHSWEADSRIFDAAVVVGSGLAITAVDQGLKVATIALGGRNYSGLVGHGGAGDASIVVGYVTKLPAKNGGKLRLRGGLY